MRDELAQPEDAPTPEPATQENARSGRLWLVTIVLGLLLVAAVYTLSRQYFLSQSVAFANGRATLYATTLDNALTRFQHLPMILASDHAVQSAEDETARRRLNRRLERFAAEANIEAIYLMDPSGMTVASSNYAAPKTFLGQNYSFRPYFRDASRGEAGRYYAVGATTRRAGFFMAEQVRKTDGDLLGVVAVKVDLGPLQAAWRAGGETVLVSNQDGVVVLSSEPTWMYRTLRDIQPGRRREISEQRQFGAEPLTPLDWREIDANRWTVGGRDFLHVATAVPQSQWRLHYLADQSTARDRALLTAVIAGSVLSLVLLATSMMRSERLRAALALSQARQRALQKSNQDLEEARSDLAQATRLATLGELSAAVVHELGQPLSAMRNYLAAAEISATAQRQDETLAHLTEIVGRMENTTRQLRHLAEPASGPLQPIDLRSVLDGVKLLMTHDVAEAGATLAIEEPEQALWIVGDRLRLEQAVVNLMRNALAAMEEAEQRLLSVRLIATSRSAVIEVADTGRGLGERTLSELQEPFHTTRPSGQGMGLGLAITAAIVRENGGVLSAQNRPGGGAVFRIEAPLHLTGT